MAARLRLVQPDAAEPTQFKSLTEHEAATAVAEFLRDVSDRLPAEAKLRTLALRSADRWETVALTTRRG